MILISNVCILALIIIGILILSFIIGNALDKLVVVITDYGNKCMLISVSLLIGISLLIFMLSIVVFMSKAYTWLF